jgi:uncharacterized repeat protein (TIGR01451 family)
MRLSRGSGFVRSLVPVVAFALGFGLHAPAGAQAQGLGPFVLSQAPLANAVAFQQVPTARIWVDTTAPFGLDGMGDTHHPIPADIDPTWELSLSPSRTVIVATHGSRSNCDDLAPLEIRLYQVPPVDGDLIPLGYDNRLRCLAFMVFDDRPANTAYRTAVFVENKTTTGSTGHLLWWNLVTGEHGLSGAEYTFPLNPISFSPSGTMASVPNSTGAIGGAYYSPVQLCPTGMGQASIPGVQRPGTPAAYVENGTPDRVVAYRTGGPAGTLVGNSVPYVDCTTTPEPYGACCGVLGCTQTHQGDCPGTWLQDTDCASANCPMPVLEIGLTGPATVVRGSLVTYTLTARNTGNLAASAVTIKDAVPFGAMFVSASGGGTFTPVTGQVSWSLGTLNGGAQLTRTLVVQSDCFGSSSSNATYSITGTPGGTVNGSPAVVTTLTAPSTAGLSMTFISTALSPVPLQTSDRVRHTVRIGNTSATNFDSLNFSVQRGTTSDIVQLVSDGGGNVLWSATSLSWKGLVPANSTLDITYETAIRECRGTQPTTEVLNRGAAVFLRNACSTTMVFALPTQSFAVAPTPYRIAIESPSHGPVQWWGSSDVNRMIACRPGADVDLDLRYYNNSASPGPASSLSLTLPPELSAISDPPFRGAPPAGTAWDNATHKITWSGSVGANDSVAIKIQVHMSSADCRGSLLAVGGFSTCTNALLTELAVLSVPMPPANHLLSVHNSEGLRYQDPAAGTGYLPLLCGAFESLRGMGRTADGTIWVAGMPCFRLNPTNLSFQIMPPPFTATLGMDYPNDIAEDPRDHTLVWSGYLSGFGLRVRRYNPVTGAVSVILNDTSPLTLGVGHRVVVSPDGIIGVEAATSLLRIDPANPNAYQRYFPPGGGSLEGLTLDRDGSWLTTSHPTGPTSPRNLMNVIRDSGVFSTIVNLQPWFNWQYGMPGLAAASHQDIFLGTNGDQFGVARRGAGVAVQLLPDDLSNVDLVWVGSLTDDVAGPPLAASTPFALAGAIPNPAHTATTLRFSLPHAARVTLELFDSQGRRVRTLADGEQTAGEHTIGWNGCDQQGHSVRAGVYFARLVSEGATRRVMLVLTR